MEENKVKKETKNFLAVFKKKEVCISLIAGLLLGAIIIYLLLYFNILKINKIEKVSKLKDIQTIAKVDGKEITSNDLYTEIKKQNVITTLLEIIDRKILDEMYTLTEEQEQEIAEQVEYYINVNETYYGYSEEEFLTANGFKTIEDFKEALRLSYKSNLYYEDYLKSLVSEKEINEYYENNVYGEINTKHILVETTDEVTDEQALKLAKEIIKKLDNGEDFDKVAEEYEGKVVFEELGYNGFNSGLVSEYVEASKKLENGTYSKEPVKTEFGYHIIYRIDQNEKLSLEDVKDSIVSEISSNLSNEDPYLTYKALIHLREEKGLKIEDTDLEEQYNDYCNEINNADQE